MISIGLPKLIAEWFSGRHRSTASGIYVTGTHAGNVAVLSLTNAVVLPLVGDDWRRSMFLLAAVVLAIALAWLALGRSAPASRAGDGPRLSTMQGMRRVITLRAVWPVIIIGTSGFLASHGFRNWLPQILEAQGSSPEAAGGLAALAAIAGIIGSITVMRLVGRFARVVQLLLCTTAATLAVVPFVDGVLVVVVLLVESFCAAALMPFMLNTLMEMPQVARS